MTVTREEFIAGVGSVTRHGLTVVAGLLAAKGIAGGDQLLAFGSAGAVFLGTVGWSLIEKSKLLSALCGAAPSSELETLAANIAAFHSQGSSPLLVAHMAQAVLAIAQQELMAAHPELIPQGTPAAGGGTPVPPPVAPPPAAVVEQPLNGGPS